MLLHQDLINFDSRSSGVLVSRADQSDIGKVVISFQHKHALNRHAGGGQRMRWNFHPLPASEFAGTFDNLGLSEIRNEVEFLAVDHHRVASAGRSHAWLIER